MSTIFTKIINKDIPAEIVYENESFLAFNDIAPQAPIHILIIPKKEIPSVNDMQEDELEIFGELFLIAKKLAKQLDIHKEGYRLVMNCNDYGGQTVNHIHLHLIGGRKMNWPPG